MTKVIKFNGDTSKLESLLSEIEEFKKIDSGFVQKFLSSLDSRKQMFCINSKPDTALDANNVLVTFEPTDRLTEFMTAMRARKLDLLVVE
jgi:hypothetical protein